MLFIVHKAMRPVTKAVIRKWMAIRETEKAEKEVSAFIDVNSIPVEDGKIVMFDVDLYLDDDDADE